MKIRTDMRDIKQLIRPNILNLKPYASARDEFAGQSGIFLDANENPYGLLNRYPDPYQKALKSRLAAIKNINTDQVFLGNGSDEIIDLAIRIFCTPGRDKALAFTPSYGMYDVTTAIHDVALVKVPLDENFDIDLEKVRPFFKDENIKLIFICSPNNPTGNLMDEQAIEFILKNFKGIVVVDEAYVDFAKRPSLVRWIEKYNTLIVSQTFSKAWGLAAARVGMAFTNPEIIHFLNKVKPPYNISRLNQQAAIQALDDKATFNEKMVTILKERQRLQSMLEQHRLFDKVYPSDANFLLVKTKNANAIYQALIDQKIIVRNRHKLVDNCLRISIGTPDENKSLLAALDQL